MTRPPFKKARVLIVDDSSTARRILFDKLSADPGIEVVDTAFDAYDAKDKIIQHDPDVVTLDVEMPRMDGITFLKLIMDRRPRPVIMLSALTGAGSKHAMEALQAGAFEVFGKPTGAQSLSDIAPLLIESIKAAAHNKQHRPSSLTLKHLSPKAPVAPSTKVYNPRQIMLLGASTGGTEALKYFFTNLPSSIPPTLAVQHIPAHFSTAFAERIDSLCPFDVKEAEDGDEVFANRVLIAPGDYHMTLERVGAKFYVKLNQGPKVWHQRPAVDILFKSAARLNIPDMAGAIFTGMGKDGAEGLLELKNIGCKTYNQDEASCVVYGMPRAAWELGASLKEVPLDQMAQTIMNAFNT